jgi:hypothetical protein
MHRYIDFICEYYWSYCWMKVYQKKIVEWRKTIILMENYSICYFYVYLFVNIIDPIVERKFRKHSKNLMSFNLTWKKIVHNHGIEQIHTLIKSKFLISIITQLGPYYVQKRKVIQQYRTTKSKDLNAVSLPLF